MKTKKGHPKAPKKKPGLKVQHEERRKAPTAVGVPEVLDKSSPKLYE
jgi:hypothetical protein